MCEPIAYQRDHFAIGILPAESFVTAYEWTHGRHGNVTPVIHARFVDSDGTEFDAYAKPFAHNSEYDTTLALNEATGWLLARACGLPVPDRAFFTTLALEELPVYTGCAPLPCDSQGRMLCFATQDIGPTAVRGLFSEDSLIQEQANWSRCNDTIAFDEAIANPDRHLFNLLRRRCNDFVLIDHGFLLRQHETYPEHWKPGALAQMVATPLDNLLHLNTYICQSRTAPAICMSAYQACEAFMQQQRPQMQRALFEISFWCSKLLPGRSAQWLRFLYDRFEPAQVALLLQKRFGLLPLS
ncbi:hypothetical protein EII18_02940 [Comamonadaceae bacterium OH3737_COT-264]|nr:hypothetical protein EII18_02940 [Comamonadaceae bacterium OH3737_COT-264]